jgi:REP element-mobilizing transposase RayT
MKYHLMWVSKLRKQLWAGEFWSDGCFVRSAGDRVTADIVQKYIEYQVHEEDSLQLAVFEKPQVAPQLAGGQLTNKLT